MAGRESDAYQCAEVKVSQFKNWHTTDSFRLDCKGPIAITWQLILTAAVKSTQLLYYGIVH
jgi:hypothetical protein